MMRWCVLFGLSAVALLACACGSTVTSERNPFLTLAETFGYASTVTRTTTGGSGTATQVPFRNNLTVNLTNANTTAEVRTSYAAWVNLSSIRTAQQQDALLAGGYVQLTSQLQLGSVFTLPPGTFVYNGPGMAGATPVRLGSSGLNSTEATTKQISLITPDVFLVFVQPPVSCDGVAFEYVNAATAALTDPTTTAAGFKTFAQVDVYQCEPLSPGLFLRLAGGTRQSNEYFEGSTVTFTFNATADTSGNFATVTIQ